MAASAENQKASGLANKKIIAIAAIIIVLLLGTIVFLLARQSTANISDGDVPKIGYAVEASVILDQDALQAAADEAIKNARENRIALKYQNNAYSKDGKTFSCLLANSPSNLYDMYLTIFADAEMTDQVYLSGLVPPGSGFEEITLDRALDSGNHTMIVVLTQVDTDENGIQVLKNQVSHTVEFHVE